MALAPIVLTPERRRQVMTASGVNVALGVWLILAPFILAYTVTAAVWNDVVVGIAVLILAGTRLAAPHLAGLSWANVALGMWLLLAPFALGYGERQPAMWNNITVGLGLIVFGGWSAQAVTARESHAVEDERRL